MGELTRVIDFRSATEFALQRTGGPLGRPIALASFAPQAYAWPDAPEVFLRTNILIHLFNGILVTWAAYLLTLTRGIAHERAAPIASVSGATWLLLPILASSSLLIVQRMTTLSASFLMLGFIAYFYSRRLRTCQPRLALLLMSISVIGGAGLAALTKENGALLPLLILLTEATLLRESANKPRTVPRWWVTIFLLGPTITILGYLLLRVDYGDSTRVMRDFSAPDRLLTEAHILWEYLYNAFIPSTSNLGPFHDHHPIYRDWMSPLSVVTLLGWVAAIVGALAFRRTAPLFSFAVAWYLAGHLLESTVIPLELYFEHRNYVPLMGPAMCLASSVMTLDRWKVFVRSAFGGYVLLHAAVLFNTTTIWGRPALAGEMWAIYNPDSKRATQYLVQQLESIGDYSTARRMLTRYLAQHPESAGVQLQVVALSCILQPADSHQDLLDSAVVNLAGPRFEHGVFETMRELYGIAEKGSCASVSTDTVYMLASVAASNYAYRAVPAAHHNLHILMAEHAFGLRDLELTMYHIEHALASQYTMSTLVLAVQMLVSAELYALATDFVEEARSHAPSNPARAALWRRQLARLEQAITTQSS